MVWSCIKCPNCNTGFSQTHTIGNFDTIANLMFPYICSFFLYLYDIMLINTKLDISEYNRIIFQGCKCHWCWQYWHSCIMVSL